MSCNPTRENVMNTSDPIAGVSVISTGSVAIRPEHVGPTWKHTYLWLATSRRWTDPRPINVYVVEHRPGPRLGHRPGLLPRRGERPALLPARQVRHRTRRDARGRTARARSRRAG